MGMKDYDIAVSDELEHAEILLMLRYTQNGAGRCGGSEGPFSQEQQSSQPQMWSDDALDNRNVHVQPNPSQSRYLRRSTDHDLSNMPSNISGDNTNKYSEGCRPTCRDYFRGSCARGMSCKFLHPGIVDHDGSRFGRNEPQILGHIADPRNSRFDGEVKVGDSRMPYMREHRGRSPCRKFRSGNCEHGSSCRYLHDEFRKHDRHISDWKATHHHGLGPASMKPGPFEGIVNNFLGTSQEHDSANKANDAKALSFSRDHQGRSPCRNFIRGTCRFGAYCRRWHDQSTAQQTGITVVSDGPSFVNGTHNITFRVPRNRSPCRNFLKGRCRFGATCKNWHDPSAPQQPETSSIPGSVSGSLGMCSREHSVNQHQNSRTESFVSRSTPCQFFVQGQGHLHPITICERTRYDNGIQQFQGQGPTVAPRNRFQEGNVAVNREVNNRRMHFVNDGAVNDHSRAWPMKEQLARNRVRVDVISSSGSLDRQRQSFASDYGGDNRRPEVCLRFTKGKCDQGESCRYLHSFHEYASSTSHPSKRPCLKPSGNLSQEHTTVNNARVQSSEHLCTNDVLVGRDCSFDQEARVLGDEIHMNCEQYPGMQLEQYPIGSANCGSGIPSRKNGVCAANASDPRHPCQIDERSVINSTIIEAAEGGAVVGMEHMESVSMSSSEEHHMSLQDDAAEVVEEEEDNMGESMIHLIKDGDEKTEEMMQGVKKYSRKKRKRGTSSTPCSVEPLTEERTGSLSQRPLTGVSDTMNTMAAKVNAIEDDLVNDPPVQLQGNGALTNNVKRNVETSAATTAQQISCNCDSDNNLLASLKCVGTVAPSSRRKLLVLDVNGMLADIVANFPDRFTPDTMVSGKGVFKRPFCDAFLEFCFERFDVGIWSSRNKKNITRVVDFLLENNKDRLLFCWDQSHCTQTGFKTVENQEKPLVLKELKKLWENEDKSLPWERGFYNETNTVLLDDSPYKALRNPRYTAIFPFPYSFRDVKDTSLGRDGALRLYLEKLAEADNVQTFIQENPFGQRAISKTNLSWGYYSKIIDEF